MKIELKAEISKEIAKWRAENPPEEIASRVRRIMESQTDSLVAKMLGFSPGWGSTAGGWEVDHCNGRAGESAVGDQIREHCKTQVGEWIASVIGDFKPPKGMEKAIRQEYKEQFLRRARERARELAYEHANKMAFDFAKQDLEG